MAKKNKSGVPWLFILLVIIPTALAAIYYYVYASDQYVSEAQFIIQGNDAPSIDMLGALTGLPSAGGASDSIMIQEYIRSYEFLNYLQALSEKDAAFDIKQAYGKNEADVIAALPDDASAEDTLDYWRNMVSFEHDNLSSISKVTVTAFQPETSRLLVETVLKQSENLINDASEQLRSDNLRRAMDEVEEAQQQLDQLRTEVTKFRKQKDILDPAKQTGGRIEREASARLGVVSQLQAELAKAEAELSRLREFMRPETLQVKSLQKRVNALRQQIAREQAKTSIQSQGQNKQAADDLAQYAELQSRLAFAEQLYQTKLTTLEQARIEDERKQRYLTVIVSPNLPDEAIKPEKLSGVLTVLLLSFLFWGIGSLAVASIRDHIGWV